MLRKSGMIDFNKSDFEPTRFCGRQFCCGQDFLAVFWHFSFAASTFKCCRVIMSSAINYYLHTFCHWWTAISPHLLRFIPLLLPILNTQLLNTSHCSQHLPTTAAAAAKWKKKTICWFFPLTILFRIQFIRKHDNYRWLDCTYGKWFILNEGKSGRASRQKQAENRIKIDISMRKKNLLPNQKLCALVGFLWNSSRTSKI